jgi:putative transposase
MGTVEQLAPSTGIAQACQVLGVPRSSFYRTRQAPSTPPTRPAPARALGLQERAEVRAVLNSARFQDDTPREVYATLLDEGRYLCHWRTMYRLLAAYDEVRERRQQLQHPVYTKPELLATGPNQLWSWDGRPLGRLVNTSRDVTHHQGWVSSPWPIRAPSNPGWVSFQGT